MKHADIIEKMTLEEKAAILSGKSVWETRSIERLGIPSIFCSDGPSGVRRQAEAGDHLGLNPSLKATCFPSSATLANSWDPELVQKAGAALGEEASAQKVDILLGPGLNIKRNPLCGRNFEYYSEDPYLSGKMAAAYVRGIQSSGVYACLKHFAVNSQELRRMSTDSVLDERTLREIYLTGFEIAVKESGAGAVMSSYNQVNGIYANENRHLLMDILRDDWGFEGIVITDWGGSNDHAAGVACRSNLEMPSPGLDSAREILEALDNGTLKEEELNACVDDLLNIVLDIKEKQTGRKFYFDKEAHHKLAHKAAAESIVLLKNEQEILPLKPGTKVALIGDFAFTPRYQGAGSSMVNPVELETMIEKIKEYALKVVGCAQGYVRTAAEDNADEAEALKIAKEADVILYCFGLDEISESEGLDRTHMRIPEKQIEFLQKLAGVNKNIVGILSGGSPIEMGWEKNLKGILHGYLGGQAGAGAMLDVITGIINPSGHLNETYPMKYEDVPSSNYFPAKERTAEYREGIYVGYRYYETAGVPVRYPFGYGLSYTTFEYSNLHISENGISLVVTNTGKLAGADVIQMYVSLPEAEIFRPQKELKGFAKVKLKPGESKEVQILFDDKTFRYWNTATDRWETEEGEYVISVGSNVRDIVLSGNIKIKGTTNIIPEGYKTKCMRDYYYTGNVKNVMNLAFADLLGHEIPHRPWDGELDRNDAICQMYYAKNPLARGIYKVLKKMKEKSEAAGKPDLNILFIYNMPFRGIAKMTGGTVSQKMVDGMVMAVNGHFFRGIYKILSGYLSNIKANKEYEERLRETE